MTSPTIDLEIAQPFPPSPHVSPRYWAKLSWAEMVPYFQAYGSTQVPKKAPSQPGRPSAVLQTKQSGGRRASTSRSAALWAPSLVMHHANPPYLWFCFFDCFYYLSWVYPNRFRPFPTCRYANVVVTDLPPYFWMVILPLFTRCLGQLGLLGFNLVVGLELGLDMGQGWGLYSVVDMNKQNCAGSFYNWVSEHWNLILGYLSWYSIIGYKILVLKRKWFARFH